MRVKEIKRAVRNAQTVVCWIKLSDDFSETMKISKHIALSILSSFDNETELELVDTDGDTVFFGSV